MRTIVIPVEFHVTVSDDTPADDFYLQLPKKHGIKIGKMDHENKEAILLGEAEIACYQNFCGQDATADESLYQALDPKPAMIEKV